MQRFGRRLAKAMRKLTIDRYVAAPIERVYAAYVDPALMPTWMELRAVIDMTGPLDRAGTRFTQVVFGWWWSFRAEVLRAEPPTLHEMTGRGPVATSYRWLARFAPEGDGTRVTVQFDTRVFGRLNPLAERVFARSGESQASRHLATLAALAEARPGAADARRA
jgi:uncharacterized protein YndB with AHSA1/START domain